MCPRHFCQSDWSSVCRLESGSRRTFVGSTKYFRLLTLVISLWGLGRSGYRLWLVPKTPTKQVIPGWSTTRNLSPDHGLNPDKSGYLTCGFSFVRCGLSGVTKLL